MTKIQPKRVGIVCKGRDEDITVLNKLIESIEDRVDIVLDESTANKLQTHGMKLNEMSVDLLICIGGDGTILRALHALQTPTPMLGINMGAIGFLAEVQPEESVSTLTRLLEGFEVERKERLAVTINGTEEKMPYAMNEAVVITSKPGKMLHFAIFIDEVELERLRADGVIFATPTGSTAYAMSAGGPIVDPQVNATIIVPIAPFKLAARPTVVDITSEIRFELLERKNAELVIDGQFYRAIGKEERISITRGAPAFFVNVGGKHFLKLRDKLRDEEEKGKVDIPRM
ncbi:MAG TPA: NAD(+)/NADH kinase [Desulfobacteria bacterium]|nr:NAD(+)/NADH kinase [Desulfobacteria bacterium]